MDEKQKCILDRNKGLLVGNMVMSEDFFRVLRSENVLPDTMVRDIQTRRSQYERNTKLLETLRLRGGDSYRKFRHVLYMTGHLLLADHLHGEDIETKLLGAEEVFGKFPKVFNHVGDDTKTKLLRYLETKVKERAITNAWLTTGQERSDLLEAKKIHYEAEKDYRIKLEIKTKKMIQMREECLRQNGEIKSRDEEITRLQNEIGDMQKSFKQELAKQTRFNAANNSSVIQLRDRFDNFNERVKTANIAVRQFLDPEQKDMEEDPENSKMSFLERNVRKLIKIARINLESTSSSISEKETVLNLLRTSSRHKQHTLSEIVQQYVEKQEHAKLSIANELTHLLDSVRGSKLKSRMASRPAHSDLKYLNSQMALLREEVDHMKKKIEWKDSHISDLIMENTHILDQNRGATSPSSRNITFPRLSTSSIPRDSPDSIREIERVYEQFDRLYPETVSPPLIRRGSLADVNLEHSLSSSHRSRRHSKIDAVNLDLFGSTSQYIRSQTDTRAVCSQSLVNMPTSIIDKAVISKPVSTMNEKLKLEMKRRKESEPEAEHVREDRRPSLAELITIYENVHDEHIPDDTTGTTQNKLPILQAT